MPSIDDIANDAAIKAALKEGLREWLDEKYAELGKWSLKGLAAAAIAGIAYLAMVSSGWHKGP